MARITTYRMPPQKRKGNSKYGNRKCTVDGYTFDSVKEMNRYMDLKFLLLSGKIKDLELQKEFTLQESFRDINGRRQQSIRYICDFYYFDIEKDKWVIEDVKSPATSNNAVYKIKKKMMLYRGLEITEV